MRSRLPAAVLWDMDGTLVDTEPYWMAEEYALAREHGVRWDEADALDLVGLALLDSAALIIARTGMSLLPEQVVARLVAGVRRRMRQQIPWRPGARELLTQVRAAGIPCGLVTMSYRDLTDELENALPPGALAVVVSGEDVQRGKPDPQPYLRAAHLLGVDPSDCLAIEDSEAGARSAAAAGARTVVVAHVKPVPQIAGTVQVASLHGLDLAGLVQLGQSLSRPPRAGLPQRPDPAPAP